MPQDHQKDAYQNESAKLVSSFASAVESSSQKLTRENSDPHDSKIMEIPNVSITYIRPNGIDSSRVILKDESSAFSDSGFSFHFSTEEGDIIKKEIIMKFESLPGRPSEVVSESVLGLDEIEILAKFAANPELYSDLAKNLMVLTEKEKLFEEEDRERFDLDLDEIREDSEYPVSFKNGISWEH